MSNTSPAPGSDYLEDQILKQYANFVKTPNPALLNSDFCKEAIASLKTERMQTLESLILYKSITQIHAALEMKYFSVTEMTLFFLHRTLRFNAHYGAIISLNPDSLTQAAAIDARLSRGEACASLIGIPVWLKDNIATLDPIPTTGGAAIFATCFAKKDAPVVAELRKSGSIFLGKTNLSEWANFMSSNSSNGYSVIGGQTHSPYGQFDVGGSSSGSAVAVALGLSPVSIGSETCGSLVYPASQNGVSTLKPTHESLSGLGILPIASSLDTAGPMALYVADLHLTYCALGGLFPKDEHPDFLHSTLHKKRIGLALSPALTSEFREGDLEFLYRIKSELIQMGAEVITVNIPEAAFTPPLLHTLHEEFEPCLESYCDYVGCGLTLQEIIDFNKSDLEHYAPYGQDLLKTSHETLSQVGSPLTLEMKELSQSILSNCLKDHHLDAIYNLSNYLAILHALSGFPALTVPCGFRPTGEPIGVTFVGHPEQLKTLFEISYLYQEGTHHQRPPEPHMP